MRRDLDWYELTDQAWVDAWQHAVDTGNSHQNHDRKDLFAPIGETRFEVDLRGFGAELIAEQVTGLRLHWVVLDAAYRGRKPPDLGNRTEVRSTTYEYGHLPIHPERDDPGSVYLLVVGRFPRYAPVGWIEGEMGMRDQYWAAPPRIPYACYWVPQSVLHRLPLPTDA